jgi:hypothetical protein
MMTHDQNNELINFMKKILIGAFCKSKQKLWVTVKIVRQEQTGLNMNNTDEGSLINVMPNF